MIAKACPLVTRPSSGGGLELLVFRHPIAGVQLVKGTIEPRESPAGAALRELKEEAGITAVIEADLGSSGSIAGGEVWSFFHCRTLPLPDRWTHYTLDGGGLLFAFSWWPATRPTDTDWHPVFARALAYAVDALG